MLYLLPKFFFVSEKMKKNTYEYGNSIGFDSSPECNFSDSDFATIPERNITSIIKEQKRERKIISSSLKLKREHSRSLSVEFSGPHDELSSSGIEEISPPRRRKARRSSQEVKTNIVF
jgi:hypothetical protein